MINGLLFTLFRHIGIEGGRYTYDLLIMGIPLDKLDKFHTYFWFEHECRLETDSRELKVEIAKRLGFYRCNPWDSHAEDYYRNLDNLDHLNYLFEGKIEDYKDKLNEFLKLNHYRRPPINHDQLHRM